VRLLDDADRPIPWRPVTVTVEEFESDIARVLQIAGETVERCLTHRDVARDRIRKVLLVGGSSHIPAFRRMLAGLVPQARLHDEVDPSHSVALGAALYANSRPALSRISPYGYDVVHDDETRTELIQANSEVPTPEYAHYGLAAWTRYAAQTIYRLTLAPFAERGGVKVPMGTMRLFGRGLPPTALGTRVDVEIWLDEHKQVQAQCHVAGHVTPVPLESLDKAGKLVFSELLDANLEAGALLEANERADGGLIARIKRGFELSGAALASRSHAHAEKALQILHDVADQVADKHRWAEGAALPRDEQVRRRIAGWIRFHEEETLPVFWELLSEESREAAMESIKALRVMLKTSAPAETLDARYGRLLEELAPAGPVGVAVQAFRESTLMGMPDRIARELRVASMALRQALMAKDDPAVTQRSDALQALRAEGDAAWNAWQETDPLLAASPDLVVPKEPPRDGN
jgi:hypothetical protein